MTFFRHLYLKVVNLSKHHHAPYYLAGVSFVESSFFPIPPDVILIPMVLGKPLKAWQYATITTISSILGGLLGYAIGYYFFELIGEPMVKALGYQVAYLRVVEWFSHYGFYALLIAGFTPIPYKLFTIASGAAQMLLFPFIIASVIGRGCRFFLVAGLLRYFGMKVEKVILKYIDIIAWSSLAIVMVIFLFISGCSLFSKQAPAPVVEMQYEVITKGVHVVQPGESLYAIAWRYGRDYREIAQVNAIAAPYVIHPGQKIALKKPTAVEVKTTTRSSSVKMTPPATPFPKQAKQWAWPTQGKIIKHYQSKGIGLKGIDIQGEYGSNIMATNHGKVVYAGEGLRGYGLLVIVKHDDTYLSAYAHNSKLFVKEGDPIKQGQVIAAMGKSGADRVKLHFQIRKNGQPVDPLNLLPAFVSNS